jgi:UDP:flavonoid glycosyltransferase YjiC (YdhE family)
MADILFATLDAGGNIPPILAIGGELVRRGHRVRMLSHEANRARASEAGIEFTAYRHSPAYDPLGSHSTCSGLRMYIDLFTSPAMGADLLDAVRDDPADVVVVDCMLLSVIDAAAEAGLTHAVLFHSFVGYYDRRWRRGPIGIVARLKGLGPRRLWRNADLALVCSDDRLDPVGSGSAVWVGILTDADRAATPQLRPRVLASLSTINFPGQQQVLQHILTAVDGMPLDLVLTTGPAADPASLEAPSNAVVHQYLPHNELMPTCSAVIGHGGHATMARALGYGLPMLILPMHPLLDQPLVGKAIERAGAGITLRKTAKPEQIRTALERLLREESYHTKAAEFGERLRQNNAATRAADRLLELTLNTHLST